MNDLYDEAGKRMGQRMNRCEFNIIDISDGWFTGEIKDDSKSYFFDYSYLTDFPKDFINTLICVHTTGNKLCFKTEWEPAVDIWEMAFCNNKLYINIKNYDSAENNNLAGEKNFEFDYQEFLNAFIMSIRSVIDKYGLNGYKDRWGFDFPQELFEKLFAEYGINS